MSSPNAKAAEAVAEIERLQMRIMELELDNEFLREEIGALQRLRHAALRLNGHD
jgi:FtsZ-binding cell division protein ZapB